MITTYHLRGYLAPPFKPGDLAHACPKHGLDQFVRPCSPPKSDRALQVITVAKGHVVTAKPLYAVE